MGLFRRALVDKLAPNASHVEAFGHWSQSGVLYVNPETRPLNDPKTNKSGNRMRDMFELQCSFVFLQEFSNLLLQPGRSKIFKHHNSEAKNAKLEEKRFHFNMSVRRSPHNTYRL